MRTKAVSWAWDQKAGLTEAKLILVLLADMAGDDGRVALSDGLIDLLAKRSEIDHAQLGEYLAWLSRRGLIAWVEPFKSAILPIDAEASELARAAFANQRG
ncbi:MAG: hypothetical protein FJX45_19725 [Alphaproteobacteria bacterium]|nr:hypothetical protein [Alphaproteobacteria bacterium]